MKTDVHALMGPSGASISFGAGNITCYASPTDDKQYIIRFRQDKQISMTRKEAVTLLNNLAYRLMSVAPQL